MISKTHAGVDADESASTLVEASRSDGKYLRNRPR